MKPLYLLSFFICLVWVAPLNAQLTDEMKDVFDRGCGDDDGNDRCDREVQAKMRSLYDWKSAEVLTEEGVAFRRMMFVDGYGNDVVGIEFSRKPGQSPRVRIETPKQKKGPQPSELSAAIARQGWENIIERSSMFEQKLAREVKNSKGDKSGMIQMCLHGWFVVAEAGDASRLHPNIVGQRVIPADIRRDAEGSCAKGLTVPYAFQIADKALELLPDCQSIPKNYARNIPQLLALCHRLGGDRLAAAEALEITKKLESRTRNRKEKGPLRWLLAQSAQELLPDFSDLLERGGLHLGLPSAKDMDHASVKGAIIRSGKDDGDKNLIADVSFQLVRQAGDFVVLSFEQSEFRELKLPH
ncbi:MAG: hypothetical protein ABJN65_09365 [Parasphingorhabdus sp.]